MGVPQKRYHLDTIARFALMHARSYPRMARYHDWLPFNDIYSSAANLFRQNALRKVISSRFSFLFVDEYQDCTSTQHDMILSLSESLSCIILGDPLQGIFGFDIPLVDWPTQVDPHFEQLAPLITPYRWAKTNPALGEWLIGIRGSIEAGEQIDLLNAPVNHIQTTDLAADQLRLCYHSINLQGSVVSLLNWPNQAQDICRKLKGNFLCAETMEMDDLLQAAIVIDQADGSDLALEVIKFASCCFSGLPEYVKHIHDKLRNHDADFSHMRKHPAFIESVRQIVHGEKIKACITFLRLCKSASGVYLFRGELYSGMMKVLEEKLLTPNQDLKIIAKEWIEKRRFWSKNTRRLVVSRPLLVKGLEYDHCFVLDTKLKKHELYVSLTRGAKTLTVLNDSNIIRIAPPTTRISRPSMQGTLWDYIP